MSEKKKMPKALKRTIIILIIAAIATVIGFTTYFVIQYASSVSESDTTVARYTEFAESQKNVTFDEETGLLYMNNEIILLASDGAQPDDIKTIISDNNYTVSDCIEDLGIYCLTFSGKMTAEELEDEIKKLKKSEYVDNAYINPVYESTADVKAVYPSDPWNGSDWDTDAPEGNNWGLEAVRAPYAWAYLDMLEEVNVGLIDGIPNSSHKDLDIKVFVTNYDAKTDYSNTRQVITKDTNSSEHGTHVAGTIGATFGNSEGVTGVMADKGNMYYSTVNTFGSSSSFNNVYNYIKEISVLLDNDVRAINISRNTGRLEGFAASMGNSNAAEFIESQAKVAGALLKRIIENREKNGQKDFVICMSAGNSNNTTYYVDNSSVYGYSESYSMFSKSVSGGSLAKYNHFFNLIDDPAVKNRIIVVGSAGLQEGTSPYTYSTFSNVGDRVDIVAPGEYIYSLSNNGYNTLSGTSMAAPHVTGAAGLAFAANPDLSGPEVKNLICSTAKGRLYYEDGFSGMLDVEKVVTSALSAKGAEFKQELIPEEAPAVVKSGLDLCFVVDTTGSMNDDIDNAKENMSNILASLSEKSSDYRVALVDYQTHNSYASVVRTDFTNNTEIITNAINELTTSGGGAETVYSGINTALGLSWRDNAEKVIIVLGDEPAADPEPYTGFTRESILQALYNANVILNSELSDERAIGKPEDSEINLFAIDIKNGGGDSFSYLAEMTGGKYTNIESAEEVSTAIVESIKEIKIDTFDYKLEFGEDFSNETVDIYDEDDNYMFSFELDNKGRFELESFTKCDCTWVIDRLSRQGRIFFGRDKDAEIEFDSASWYNFVVVMWHRNTAVFFILCAVLIIGIVAVPVAILLLKKAKKKRNVTSIDEVAKEGFTPEETSAEPVAEPTEEPTEEPIEEPKEEPIEEPKEEPVEEPAEEPIKEPVEKHEKARFCPECGNKVEDGTAFCMNCGTKL